MAEYVSLADLGGYCALESGHLLAFPEGSGEGQDLEGMQIGDHVAVVLVRRHHSEAQDNAIEARCSAVGGDFAALKATFESETHGGQGTALYKATVTGAASVTPFGMSVPVNLDQLHPAIPENEFFRLRKLPYVDAQQLVNRVSGRRFLACDGIFQGIDAWSADSNAATRHLFVVAASDVPEAKAKVGARSEGDRILVVQFSGIVGLFEVEGADDWFAAGGSIAHSLSGLERLFSEAAARTNPADVFDPAAALDAAAELQSVVGSDPGFLEITDPGVFYRRYDRLHANVTAALSIESEVRQPNVPAAALDASSFDLSELSIDAIKAQLPGRFEVGDETLQEVVAGIRSGKHILLSGPPGTGKSTLAEATCKAVVGSHFDVATATADWTTFDTIGGYIPRTTGPSLVFEPGIVLRALHTHRWLVIDEINRADIDKAFGPLFSVLSGSDAADNASVVLPYQEDGEHVRVVRSGRPGAATRYTVTPQWRLFGTLNVSDKASLFQLSFAFLRRFAVIDVPIPPDEAYEAWIKETLGSLADAHPELPKGLLKAATGPRALGPAIMEDAVSFAVAHHELQTDGAAPLVSVVVALCLFAIPQYEGATKDETDRFVAAIESAMPLGDLKERLKDALSRVSLG